MASNSPYAFTCSLDDIDNMNDFEYIIWNIIPVSVHNQSNSKDYFIKPKDNNNNDLYLCAMNQFENVLQPRYKYH